VFEAEAMRYGRLAGAELGSFERHMTVCPACSREVQALEALAQTLRANPPADADELHVRRERTRLLAAFDRGFVAPPRRWGAWRRMYGLLTVAACVAGLFVVWRMRRPVPTMEALSAVVVRADSTAAWSKRSQQNREEIVLERGALWIHTEHASAEARVVVVLPDGELEDRGTTFTVSAEDGHTTRVTVQEGSVELRIRDQPPVTIGPGNTWVREPAPAPSTLASVAAPTELSPDRSPSQAPTPPPRRSSSPIASAPPAPDPSLDFRTAIARLDAGDNRAAAAAFASFLVKHPRDPRAQDAAYLRVIALQRCGDKTAMKESAQEYLRRYPAGLRRAEVEPLAR
jgi:hypothetical protein